MPPVTGKRRTHQRAGTLLRRCRPWSHPRHKHVEATVSDLRRGWRVLAAGDRCGQWGCRGAARHSLRNRAQAFQRARAKVAAPSLATA